MASTHILAVGKIVRDGIEMDVSMPPWLDPHESIELPLQDMIDEAAEAADYEDDEPWPLQANERMGDRYDGSIEDDEEWIRRGC